MKKQPEKTAQTKQALINAFWDIAIKRGLYNTTISEITKQAELNRGTFYVYFSDLDDLRYHAEQDIICDLRSKVSQIILNEHFNDTRYLSSKMIEVFGKYDDKLFMLLGRDGDPMFLDLVRKEAAIVFSSVLQLKQEYPYQDYIIAYATSAFTGLLQFWYETGKEISLTELSEIAHSMITFGLQGLKQQYT